MTVSNKKHLLFSGDNYGHSGPEVWTEHLRYLGDDQWEMTVKFSTDIEFSDEPEFQEAFNTESLVNWVLERDEEHREAAIPISDIPEDEEPRRQLFDHGSRLLEIAHEEKVRNCVSALEGWLNGTWPPPPPTPRIIRVTGAEKRMVGLRTFRAVYGVETDAGPGFLYPPDDSNEARLILKSSGVYGSSWTVELTEELKSELSRCRLDIEALEAEL